MSGSITILLAAVLSYNLTTLQDAIWEVETGRQTGEIWGDTGTSLGPLQISEAAWIDSGISGVWKDCVDLEYSLTVFDAYMDRYATEKRLGHVPTQEDRARIWNGGPNGFKEEATVVYWNKVKAVLEP